MFIVPSIAEKVLNECGITLNMHSDKRITLTYLNLRQSISVLIAKLIATDIIMAFVVIFFYYLLVNGRDIFAWLPSNAPLFLVVFTIAGLIKIWLNIFTVLLWLNEYYEITPEYVVHRKGVFFKKQFRYRLEYVRMMKVVDNFIGELFNFGTITLYDIRLNKYLDMYLIHNPRRYAAIFRQLYPKLEIKEDHVWIPFKKKSPEDIKDVEIETED